MRMMLLFHHPPHDAALPTKSQERSFRTDRSRPLARQRRAVIFGGGAPRTTAVDDVVVVVAGGMDDDAAADGAERR